MVSCPPLRVLQVVFLVTDFWRDMNVAREEAEGKAFVDAVAATPSVKKFVFSALEDVTKATGGKLTKVAHFDGKGHIEEYIRSKGLPAVFVLVAAYMENWIGFFPPRKDEQGNYAVTLPDMGDAPYNQVSVAEMGGFVAAILKHWDEYVGKDVPLVSDLRPMREVRASAQEKDGDPRSRLCAA
jgi:uncharacterized protein YbjT (DUF2867 family)